MSYDAAYRQGQALDPSAINTLPAALHALNAAIDDCRSTGVTPEADPAVLLLARRLGHVATAGKPHDSELRRACTVTATETRRRPALVEIMAKDLGYNPVAKAEFHKEGRKALKRLAAFLELAPGSFEVRSNVAGIAVSGEVVLHGTEVYVMLEQRYLGPGNEVLYRRVAGRKDYTGERNHFADVGELVDTASFAAKLRRDLGLVPMTNEPATLVA